MKLAIVVTGGNAPLFIPDTLPLKDVYVIAADSGLDVAELLGLESNIAVGDFDSIENNLLLNNIEYKEYPRDKDYSDTELAIKYVKDLGYKNYILIGGGEGRMDHLLNIWSLFEKYGSPICWITRQEAMYRVDKKRSFITSKGETVSFIPSSFNVNSKVNSEFLKWPLKDFCIDNKHLSLSNEAIKGNLVVEVDGGPVYVIFKTPRENHW